MAVFEVYSTVSHRSLMNKSKSDLASMILELHQIIARKGWQPLSTAPKDRQFIYLPPGENSEPVEATWHVVFEKFVVNQGMWVPIKDGYWIDYPITDK